jgi:PKD repeat protein
MPMKTTIYSVTALIVILLSCSSCKKEDPPVANFCAKSTAYLLEEVKFGSACENANTVEWDFGDGSYTTGTQVKHIYQFAGTFTVTVTAKNDAGEDVYSRSIGVKDGEAEYNVINETSTDIFFFSETFNAYGDLESYVSHDYIVSGDSSDYVLTRAEEVFFGGTNNAFTFICKYPLSITDFTKNHFIMRDTTVVYIVEDKAPRIRKNAEQMIFRELDK